MVVYETHPVVTEKKLEFWFEAMEVYGFLERNPETCEYHRLAKEDRSYFHPPLSQADQEATPPG